MKKTIFYSLCRRSLTAGIAVTAITVTTACATSKQGETAEPATTIFLGPGRVEPTLEESIVAQAEAAGAGMSFDQALPLMIASLEHNGIENILVEKQGHCDVGGRGKYVEAVAGYCDEELTRAELFVDGSVFFRQTGPDLVLDDFISEARMKLNSAGILTNPRVSLNNLSDCPQQTTSS